MPRSTPISDTELLQERLKFSEKEPLVEDDAGYFRIVFAGEGSTATQLLVNGPCSVWAIVNDDANVRLSFELFTTVANATAYMMGTGIQLCEDAAALAIARRCLAAGVAVLGE